MRPDGPDDDIPGCARPPGGGVIAGLRVTDRAFKLESAMDGTIASPRHGLDGQQTAGPDGPDPGHQAGRAECATRGVEVAINEMDLARVACSDDAREPCGRIQDKCPDGRGIHHA